MTLERVGNEVVGGVLTLPADAPITNRIRSHKVAGTKVRKKACEKTFGHAVMGSSEAMNMTSSSEAPKTTPSCSVGSVGCGRARKDGTKRVQLLTERCDTLPTMTPKA